MYEGCDAYMENQWKPNYYTQSSIQSIHICSNFYFNRPPPHVYLGLYYGTDLFICESGLDVFFIEQASKPDTVFFTPSSALLVFLSLHFLPSVCLTLCLGDCLSLAFTVSSSLSSVSSSSDSGDGCPSPWQQGDVQRGPTRLYPAERSEDHCLISQPPSACLME